MTERTKVEVSKEDLANVESIHLRLMEAKIHLADFMTLIQAEALAGKTSDVESAQAAFQGAISECAKKYNVPEENSSAIWELDRDECCFIRRELPADTESPITA